MDETLSCLQYVHSGEISALYLGREAHNGFSGCSCPPHLVGRGAHS